MTNLHARAGARPARLRVSSFACSRPWLLIEICASHALTFRREVELIWRAPHTISKYGFLVNRYMVPAVLATVFYAMSGFVGASTSVAECKRILTASLALIVVSLAISTLLVILRVIALWEHSRVSVVD
jgi:hypothetical protein